MYDLRERKFVSAGAGWDRLLRGWLAAVSYVFGCWAHSGSGDGRMEDGNNFDACNSKAIEYVDVNLYNGN
jgi:hypothetical protein